MATLVEQCVNYAINLQMCPCTVEDCERRGICCECLRANCEEGTEAACMSGVGREPATMELNLRAQADCPTNKQRNLDQCVCTWSPCERKGVCCNCVRNHFTVNGSDRVACMK